MINWSRVADIALFIGCAAAVIVFAFLLAWLASSED